MKGFLRWWAIWITLSIIFQAVTPDVVAFDTVGNFICDVLINVVLTAPFTEWFNYLLKKRDLAKNGSKTVKKYL